MIGYCYCSKQDICRFAVFCLTPWNSLLNDITDIVSMVYDCLVAIGVLAGKNLPY